MSNRTYGRNAFETGLNGGITAGATSIALDSASGLTAPGYLVIEPENPTLREYIKFTGISTNTLTGVTRGLAGSSSGAQAHSTGVKVRTVFMHQMLDDIFSDIEALEAADAALDHGTLPGLADDDHSQYLNEARHQGEHGAIFAELGANQVIPNDTETTVVFDTLVQEDDTDDDVDYATGTGVMTFNTTGWYLVVANLLFSGNTGDVQGLLTKNGTITNVVEGTANVNAVGQTSIALTYLARLAATDTLRVRVFSDQSGFSVRGAGSESSFSAVRLR